ncbi:MAG: ABC transporter ATP-binding protein [Thermoplasmata archaeon]|nr:MAG: ABC transporter ATP-binding protein [Thermoplasmata archaeon]
MEEHLRLVDIWKTYDGSNYVLKGISLSVERGKIIAIKGRSGSGKTTLFNIMGCLDKPTKGEVYIDGMKISALKRKDLANIRLRKIGHIFQSHNLIDDLTVLENVMLPMRLAKRKDAKKRAFDLLAHFEIEHLASKTTREISGGELERVAIARALANEPEILLADEPTASLDYDNSITVLETFRKINAEMGTTVLIASHDPLINNYVDIKYKLERGILTRV